MIKSRNFVTGCVSIVLHLGVAWFLFHVTEEPISARNQANIASPVVSIALTEAAQEVVPEEQKLLPEPAQTQIESPVVVEKAAIVIPKNQKKVDKKRAKPTESKEIVVAKKEKLSPKETDKPTKNENTESVLAKVGDKVNSQSGGVVSATSKVASGEANNQLMNEYREKLRREVESNKTYPRRAKKMKNRGMAKVQFQLSGSGDISSARLVASSGNELLDNAALIAVEKSRSVGAPPIGFARSITLNIEFN
ncbi:energy transducer TonB [Providencia vermicola]|uniref:energy transducer TonB n=1 Tax=Providencia vermicola TaxID=333965 RepID=UPI001CECB9E5|nr:energy transducer TonB [Providencia vermicola]USR64356.1 energy transducer TonB [Providencia stuartii]